MSTTTPYRDDPSESTPFITTGAADDLPGAITLSDAPSKGAANARTTGIVTGTWVSLLTSVLILITGIAVQVLYDVRPKNMEVYWANEHALTLVILSAIALILALTNLISLSRRRLTLAVPINIIADIILGIGPIVAAAKGFARDSPGSIHCQAGWWEYKSPSYGRRDREFHEYPIHMRSVCDGMRVAMFVCVLVCFVAGIVLGITHLGLLVMRVVRLYKRADWRRRFGRKAGGFRVPTGQFTLEFTVKLLRQDENNGSQNQVQTVTV